MDTMETKKFVVRSLTTHNTGAEILGLDLSKPIGETVRRTINELFTKYHVLVFRGQDLSPEQFAAAGEIFGAIMPQHHKQLRESPNVEVYAIRNEEVEPGKYLIAGETFHTDHSDHQAPPRATALHAISLPTSGGDTQFVNMHNAYDDLPGPMKNRLDGLKAVHVFQSKYSPRALRAVTNDTRGAARSPAIHPLVRMHPENGRKFLYLNPVRIETVIDMPDDEALALINELMEHATQRRYEYRHQWMHGDMLIWDNRSVMHKANADYDMKQKRHLYRLMVV